MNIVLTKNIPENHLAAFKRHANLATASYMQFSDAQLRAAFQETGVMPELAAGTCCGQDSRLRKAAGKYAPPAPAAGGGGWPSWAKLLRTMKADGERGVGDTAERLFGLFGSDQFTKWHAAVFDRPCPAQCPKVWNDRFGYAAESPVDPATATQ